MADDPWHVVKNEISTTLAEVERLHAAASGLSGPAARPHLEKLESCLTAAELDLQDLEETISIVEAERARFPIADAELEGESELRKMERQIRALRVGLADNEERTADARLLLSAYEEAYKAAYEVSLG